MRTLYTFILLTLFSCTQQNYEKNIHDNNFSSEFNTNQKGKSSKEFFLEEAFIEDVKDSLIIMKFSNGLSFSWDIKKNRIQEDSLYKYILSNFEEKKLYLADQIMNLSKTSVSVCGKKEKMVVGDFAFLIIDKIDNKLPTVDILQSQLDSYTTGCPYAYGFFEILDKDRTGIKERVKHYFSH